MASVVRLSTIGFVIITVLFVLYWPFLAATAETPDRNSLAAANTPRIHRLTKRQFGGRGRGMGLGNFGSFGGWWWG
ncbi:hypothetical protein Ddc_24776 [Ditylenchus destructor]|nr:hypothetical protein Ddc_24776 [Ditylenchus destructor]